MNIRTAVKEDARRIILFRNTFRNHESRAHINSNRELIDEDLVILTNNIKADNYITLVAVMDSEIIGFLTAKVGKHKFSHRIEAGLVISPLHFRKGIGKDMLNLFESHIIKNGLKRVDIKISELNTKSIAFFEKSGYLLEGSESCGLKNNNGTFSTLLLYAKVF